MNWNFVEPAADCWDRCGALSGASRLRLQLLDYPGEWLLDLPLLELSYRRWSAETLARLREKPRSDVAAEFLSFVNHIDPARTPTTR